jgi:hypothetical protein
LAIIENLLNALDKSYPSASTKVDMTLPCLFAFARIPTNILESLKALPIKLDLDSDFIEYLEDCFLMSTPSHPMNFFRVFQSTHDNFDGERQARRLKAEALLLQTKGLKVVDGAHAMIPGSPDGSHVSAAHSHGMESSGEDEGMAVTPDMGGSEIMVFDHVDPAEVGAETMGGKGKRDWIDGPGLAPQASRH